MRRWHVLIPAALAVVAFAGVFQVRVTDEGVSLLYRWGGQARECDEGGGCVVISGRQLERIAPFVVRLIEQERKNPQKPGML